MSTPYELRFQIFEAAKQSLVDEYWAIDSHRRLILDGIEPVNPNTCPDHPKYPTLEEIMNRARNINDFVSSSTY